jgi:hypothetical protein
MKIMKSKDHPPKLQIPYLIIILILFFFIIYTPTFIEGPLHISKKLIIEEETVEGALIGILFMISVLILNLYKNEVDKHKQLIQKINDDKKKIENRLLASDQYIGKVNVQMLEIKSNFNGIDDYPMTKTDFKKIFSHFGVRILGIVNTDWALIRIINCKTQRTISEHFETKSSIETEFPHISNKWIIEEKHITSHTSIIYNPPNLNILVFCILPVEKISNDERIFIREIIVELTKMVVIINSTYYKNDNKIRFEDNSPEPLKK